MNMVRKLLEKELTEMITGGGDLKETDEKEPFNLKEVSQHPYIIGLDYHVRTVTMAIAGTLLSVYDKELVFQNASWVADTGRFSAYLKDTDNVSENEPFPNDVIIGRGSIIDCTQVSEAFKDLK